MKRGGDPTLGRRRERRRARAELRVLARTRWPGGLHDDWTTSHPGNPLGAGYPIGDTLREDGESHREAWMRVVRSDPCAYCDETGGTVDHIDPQSGPRHGGTLHAWCNYAGSCPSCNSSKGAAPLLLWLARRPIRTARTHVARRAEAAA